MYDRILVPTDGSDVAEAAVDHALDLAEKYDAEVHALYVVDIDSVNISLGTEQVDRIKQGRFDEMDELKEQAEAATGVVADRGAERDVDIIEHVAGGRPHKVIADYAENHDIDIIVMGSHGRAGVRRALLGSVTERTLRSTHVPVLVVDYLDED
ncbi:Nucleotide-binding universal stress protein, UspA family [Halorubrum ezzemoulense]|uniref:Nucleotide-binding universal stress protein, UspA family n=1 Tax=Halorubrum ezzemoulense TaxID=337243 RepID=A0A238UQL1_HALEZ|nr:MULTISPECIES: universal stress protein [Halorubrum]MDB2262798.1 universal stress protein [Halorubrum ezzemoulense]MDB2273227.1 universal stress protein [Halorubrum ezzemoulense]MDB9300916.1 universal stress protein [Halorubrum ezzemoulense]TKX39881.1 universal stress protein [Halorubrum sp. CGM4_25_10-8A]TKX65189.1 universal stress protein [Halorubrum sp. GN12_10-3_MGM]